MSGLTPKYNSQDCRNCKALVLSPVKSTGGLILVSVLVIVVVLVDIWKGSVRFIPKESGISLVSCCLPFPVSEGVNSGSGPLNNVKKIPLGGSGVDAWNSDGLWNESSSSSSSSLRVIGKGIEVDGSRVVDGPGTGVTSTED